MTVENLDSNNNILKDYSLINRYLSSKKRIAHSYSTARFMQENAVNFGFDPDKAFYTGLYHDLGKELPSDYLNHYINSFMTRNIITITDFEEKMKNPSILHGAAASEILIKEHKLEDIEIIMAVANHTMGGSNLSDFEKFTFVCDYCEPLREYKGAMKILSIITIDRDLDKAYFYTYRSLLKNLIKKKSVIFLESISGYNEARSKFMD